jgi:hypothetical protein
LDTERRGHKKEYMSMFDHIVKDKLGQVTPPHVEDAWRKYQEGTHAVGAGKFFVGYKIFLYISILASAVFSVALIVGLNKETPPVIENDLELPLLPNSPTLLDELLMVENQLGSNSLLVHHNHFEQHVSKQRKTSRSTQVKQAKAFQAIPLRITPIFKPVGHFSTPPLSGKSLGTSGEYVLGHHRDEFDCYGHAKYALNFTGSFGVIPVQRLSQPTTYGVELSVERFFLRGTSLSLGVGLQNSGILEIGVSRNHQGVRDSVTHGALNHIVVPATFSYPLQQNIRVHVGPQFGFLRNTTGIYHIKNSQIVPIENQKEQRLNEFHGLRTVDFGIRAGLTYATRRIQLGFRYQQSFSDFTKDSVFNDNSNHRLGTLQVTLGLTLSRR